MLCYIHFLHADLTSHFSPLSKTTFLPSTSNSLPLVLSKQPLTACSPEKPPPTAGLCLGSSLLKQLCLIGNLGKRRKQTPFNPFQAATGGRKGCLYLCMGYYVPDLSCYCTCIAKCAGLAAGAKQTKAGQHLCGVVRLIWQYSIQLHHSHFCWQMFQNQTNAKNCCEVVQGLKEIPHSERL